MSIIDFAKDKNMSTTINAWDLVACGRYGDGCTSALKIGYNPSITGTTEEDVWPTGGDYVFPATGYPAGMEIVSDSADDTADGTGARTLEFCYLQTGGIANSEEITLNGTTPVATVATDVWRVNSFRVLTAGSGKKNAGTITAREIDNSPIFQSIPVGKNRCQDIACSVPTNHFIVISSIRISSTAATVEKAYAKFTLLGNYNDGITSEIGVDYPLWEGACAGNTVMQTFTVPICLPEGVDTRVRVVGNALTDAASAYVEWRGVLIHV